MYQKVKNKIKKLIGKETVREATFYLEKSGKPKETVFARKLLEYDVISFDIFDTLILRTLNKPTDIFMLVGEKLGLLNYTTMRHAIELELRDRKECETRSREITLEEIYEEMEKQTGISKIDGMEAEFETELEHCIANPYMKEVFQMLKSYGKTIIFVSDMYLSKSWMEQLLASCGYEGYDELFVSCDYGYSKRSGKLYQHITNQYLNGRSVIHVGDNEEVDAIMAKECGWENELYECITMRGKPYRPTLMSPYVGSAYQATVNIKMHSGAYQSKNELKRTYQYGYIAGGILVLGYVCWIHEQAKSEGMDQILFIARDGYIMKQVYDLLFDDIPSKYVYLSRNAALKLTWKQNRYELLKQFVDRRIESEEKFSAEEILTSMDLQKMIPLLEDAGIKKETLVDTEEKVTVMKDFLIQHWEEVSCIYQDSLDAFHQYFYEMVKDCSHVAAVDTGWRGTCPMAIKYLIEKEWKLNCKVTGMMMGSCKYKWNNTMPFLANKDMRTYMFSPQKNNHLSRYHYKNNLIHNTCIEFITSAPHPSVHHFQKKENGGYEICFEYPEVENYEITKEIHQGVMDFAIDYKKYYGHHHAFFYIEGSDAYWPIRFMMEKQFSKMIRKPFQNYVYNKYVGGLEGKHDMITFEQMCQEEL